MAKEVAGSNYRCKYFSSHPLILLWVRSQRLRLLPESPAALGSRPAPPAPGTGGAGAPAAAPSGRSESGAGGAAPRTCSPRRAKSAAGRGAFSRYFPEGRGVL